MMVVWLLDYVLLCLLAGLVVMSCFSWVFDISLITLGFVIRSVLVLLLYACVYVVLVMVFGL